MLRENINMIWSVCVCCKGSKCKYVLNVMCRTNSLHSVWTHTHHHHSDIWWSQHDSVKTVWLSWNRHVVSNGPRLVRMYFITQNTKINVRDWEKNERNKYKLDFFVDFVCLICWNKLKEPSIWTEIGCYDSDRPLCAALSQLASWISVDVTFLPQQWLNKGQVNELFWLFAVCSPEPESDAGLPADLSATDETPSQPNLEAFPALSRMENDTSCISVRWL